MQVTWDGPKERHRPAVDAFHEEHPRAAESVFVTADAYEQGVPELPGDA